MKPATVPAIYENGVFRPTSPVGLPEGATVTLRVIDDAEAKASVGAPPGRGYPQGFFENVAGALAAAPIERLEQPELEDREGLA